MRVALHYPDDHPQHPGAVGAYRLGRIEDGVHNLLLHSGETIPLEDFVGQLVSAARAEHPDAEVVVERLIDNGDGTARWVSASEFDAEQHTPVGPGNQVVRELTATHAQEGNS